MTTQREAKICCSPIQLCSAPQLKPTTTSPASMLLRPHQRLHSSAGSSSTLQRAGATRSAGVTRQRRRAVRCTASTTQQQQQKEQELAVSRVSDSGGSRKAFSKVTWAVGNWQGGPHGLAPFPVRAFSTCPMSVSLPLVNWAEAHLHHCSSSRPEFKLGPPGAFFASCSASASHNNTPHAHTNRRFAS